MPIPFEKYEGLGNDFLVLEASALPPAEVVRRVCDRHYGVGGDGMLVLMSPSSAEATARMVVLNADGSRPEMCGNGLRCVGLHLAVRDGATSATYRVETDAGVLTCTVERDGDVGHAQAEIGRARSLGEMKVLFEGQALAFHRISVGNPHAILLDKKFDLEEIDRLSPIVSDQLTGGTNVEFVARASSGWDLIVWERGVGRTLACGTGAAATVAALAELGRAPYDEPVRIHLPGGDLDVIVAREGQTVRLRGPARRVFAGSLTGEAW